MSADIEQHVRTGLADAPTPADLRLDADAVTRLASRSHRRRRTGQTLLAGMASLAALGTVTWAGGWLPGDVQRALPASPWSACPLTWNGTGNDVHLDAVAHAVLTLSEGGTVVAGAARGCPDGDRLFFAATEAARGELPDTLPVQGGLEDRTDENDQLISWVQGLRLEDGRDVTGMIAPKGASGLVLVGPDAVHAPTSDPADVPGTGLAAAVVEGYWPQGEDLARVWRGDDGLVRTSWSAGITARVWHGDDPAAQLTDTWVGQDRQAQQWVMRDGEVNGPFPVSTAPYAVAFPTDTSVRVDVVVVFPERVGELRLEDGTALEPIWLDSHDEETTLQAALVTLEGLTAGEPLPDLTWVTGRDGYPHPVPVVQP